MLTTPIMRALSSPEDPQPPPPAQVIGRLCIAADRACASGDLETLAGIASRLRVLVAQALAADLTELAGLCHGEPARAVAVWSELKERVYQDTWRGAR